MSLPLVSILIPVYNRETVVKRAVESALCQTYPNIEVIVVDNASIDNTWEVLCGLSSKEKRLKIFRNSDNVGPVRNWEICFSYAKGDFVKFLWSDDTIAPGFLEKTVYPMIHNADIGFSYTLTEIKHPSNTNSKQVYMYGETGCYDTCSFVCDELYNIQKVPASPGCAVFRYETVRKYLISTIPNFINVDHSKTGAGNDLLLFLGACDNYKCFYYVNECLASFYAERDSISTTTDYYELLRSYDAAKCFFLQNSVRYSSEINRYFTSLRMNKHLRSVVSEYPYRFDVRFFVCAIVKRIINMALR